MFQSLLKQVERPVRILDIGGTENYWKMMDLNEDQIFITLLNLSKWEVGLPNMTSVAGDARALQMGDLSFDVVFSNSVIEHVGTFQDQLRMAQEVRRVGKRYFVQTPNKYFPIEPHFHFPFYQFLPISVRVLLLRNFNLGWISRTPDARKAREMVEEIRLLSRQEFKGLFPDASLFEERAFGMTKSFVAYGGWE